MADDDSCRQRKNLDWAVTQPGAQAVGFADAFKRAGVRRSRTPLPTRSAAFWRSGDARRRRATWLLCTPGASMTAAQRLDDGWLAGTYRDGWVAVHLCLPDRRGADDLDWCVWSKPGADELPPRSARAGLPQEPPTGLNDPDPAVRGGALRVRRRSG